jgi:hypothetical protein
VRISRSRLSKALQKNFRWRRLRHTLNGRQIGSEVERISITVDDVDGLSSTASKCQNVVAGSGTRRETVHGTIYQDRRRSEDWDDRFDQDHAPAVTALTTPLVTSF